MPFVNPLIRKRPRSSSQYSRGPPPAAANNKLARLDQVLYDGTGSRKSIESTSTGKLSRVGVKSKVKRGMSSLMTMLGWENKDNDADDLVIVNHSSLAVARHGHGGGFIHPNDSDATTVISPLRLRLTGALDPEPEELLNTQSAPLTPQMSQRWDNDLENQEGVPLAVRKSLHDLRRSQSATGLHTRITQKLHQAFGNPTVIHKAELRSRPSVHTMQLGSNEGALTHTSSSPYMYNSSSGSSPYGANKSTPATSDGLTAIPGSVRHYEGVALAGKDQTLTFNLDSCRLQQLDTIPEGKPLQGLTISTVEATATAKIFFETHFNRVLGRTNTHSTRYDDFEARLLQLNLPRNLEDKARRVYARHTSDTLRQSRVLHTSLLPGRSSKSIGVGGFEVIKILGKGSFGVVRLVKERSSSEPSTKASSAPKMFRSASRTSIKSSARGILSAHNQGRRDLSNTKKEVFAMKVIRKSDMLRNSQEGHIRAERDFLVASEGSKWIVPLLVAFQDNSFLYLIMDFCIGGDFLGLLIRKNVLSEDITKWYVAEMVLCVEEAHNMKWIHRDVKPDNFLIGADGHLKISDFGLAFDGEWEHDQKYYHKQRHDLLEKLKIEVCGDDQDEADEVEAENARRVAKAWPHSRPSRKSPGDGVDAPLAEPLLDWRNRTQARRLARSVVGTSQYMAPEVIKGDLYDGRCD